MQQACPSQQDWDPSCWHTQVKAAAAAVAPLPFLLTEYNVGCCLGYPQHDTSVSESARALASDRMLRCCLLRSIFAVILIGQAAAAFIFRAIGELNDFVELYSYWTFSDVFEEGGLPVRDERCSPPLS